MDEQDVEVLESTKAGGAGRLEEREGWRSVKERRRREERKIEMVLIWT